MRIQDIEVSGYERVARAEDTDSGLIAFIAVHSTVLGPAVGGIRMWAYPSEDDALGDALRLAEGMTYKSAVARTGLGGGKSVIVGDSSVQKTEALFEAMGRFVDAFGGTYYPAEDVGTTVENLTWVRRTTPWVAGLPREEGGAGNPSPYTAWGVFLGMQACVSDAFGTSSLANRTVAIQGLGSVGSALARHCSEAGARVIVTDVNREKAELLARELSGRTVAPESIYDVECDVFAPCALGAVINDRTIPRLRCRIVAGAANNQLERPEHGTVLMKRGILYAPDFVINAGGIIAVGCEFVDGGFREDLATDRVRRVGEAVAQIIERSRARGIPSSEAAVELAHQIVEAGRTGTDSSQRHESVVSELVLPEDPRSAVQCLRDASRTRPVLVFKKSPICPVSTQAENSFRRWLSARKAPIAVAVIDVLAQRSLARGLTSELGIPHESPQGLLFRDGNLVWHESHGALNGQTLEKAVGS